MARLDLRILLCVTQLLLGVHCQIDFNQNQNPRGNPPVPARQPQRPVQAAQADIIFDDEPVQASPSCVTPDQRQGLCKALAQCAIVYSQIPTLLDNPCQRENNQLGVCCPLDTGENKKPPPPGVGTNGVLNKPPPPNVQIPQISEQQLQQAIDVSIREVQERQKNINSIIFIEGQTIKPGTPSAAHQRFFTTTNNILDKGQDAQVNLQTTLTLSNDFNLSPLQGTFALPRFSASGTAIAKTCPQTSQCREGYPYRTIDGSCNNRNNPDWGKAATAYQRILPPKYGDGINTPRVQANGAPLPSPRLVSSSYVPDDNRPYNNLTLMLMQWSQFVDHDLTHTPIVKGVNNTGIACCQSGQPVAASARHPDCFPIDIPGDDRFYSNFRQLCMEFVRSLPAPRRECNFGPREQLDQISHYLDGSNVYGSSDDRARTLREFVGGRLSVQNSQVTRGRDLLPSNPGECSDSTRQKFCFRAGDLRVNEQTELAVMHTIWMREHNRVARTLEVLNPNWNDETLYQEARRIVIAELQHITYNEYLPLILGPEFMRTFDLTPKTSGYAKLYNSKIDPSITNEFAAAAFRFGHTLVQGIIQEINQFGAVRSSTSFAKTQFAPFSLYDSFDSLVRGLATQECQKFDNFVTDALTNHLFEGGSQFGLDLVSLNLQRGRDHGLPPYNDFREVCGFKRAQSWGEMATFMQPSVVDQLQRVYPSPDEVDLFAGGIGETPLDGAVLGPTFVCLVGDQFARLRRGDRFYYEEASARFTEAQLDQIRKVSLARVICDNSDEITVIQPLVFQQASFLNKRVPCNSPTVGGIDFNFWRSRGGGGRGGGGRGGGGGGGRGRGQRRRQ